MNLSIGSKVYHVDYNKNEITSINADYTIHSDSGDIDNLIKQVNYKLD